MTDYNFNDDGGEWTELSNKENTLFCAIATIGCMVWGLACYVLWLLIKYFL